MITPGRWYRLSFRSTPEVLYFKGDTTLKNGRLQGVQVEIDPTRPRRKPRVKRVSVHAVLDDAARGGAGWQAVATVPEEVSYAAVERSGPASGDLRRAPAKKRRSRSSRSSRRSRGSRRPRSGDRREPGELIPTPYRLVGERIVFGPSKGGQQIAIVISETGAGDPIYQLVTLHERGFQSVPLAALRDAAGVHTRKGHYYTTFQEARSDLARLVK
jgi:hypothetical protein